MYEDCTDDPGVCSESVSGICSTVDCKDVSKYVLYEDSDGFWDITHDLVSTNTKPPVVSIVDVTPKSGNGAVGVKLNFFAWADDNHMPLKKITIDWGDGQSIVSGGEGSYYQNRKIECNDTSKDKIKRCDDGVKCESTCGDGSICRARFGDSKDACKPKAFEFSHVYGCAGAGSPGWQDVCPDPSISGGCCVFRPKVQVLDNWGWCNGRCVNDYNGDGVGCYDGDWECINGTKPKNADDSYTYYDGNIIITP